MEKDKDLTEKLDSILEYLRINEAKKTRELAEQEKKSEEEKSKSFIKKTWEKKKFDFFYHFVILGILTTISTSTISKYKEIEKTVETVKNLNKRFIQINTFSNAYDITYQSRIKLYSFLRDNEMISEKQLIELINYEYNNKTKINNDVSSKKIIEKNYDNNEDGKGF